MIGVAAAQEKSAETIIAGFVDSYRAKVTEEQAEMFGIQIQGEGGGEWRVRFVHGGNMVVFYYEPGLRTAWAQIKKGMVVNKDVEDQDNPFPTLAIGIS